MCCLKLSKNIIPFAATFTIGILLVFAFTNILSCFNSSSDVKTQEVNEVKIYSSKHKSKTMCNMKGDKLTIVGEMDESDFDIDSVDIEIKKEFRVTEPKLEETIIINEQVK